MHLVQKIILVYILLLLLVPVGHYSSIAIARKNNAAFHALPFNNNSQVISGETIIGNNLSRSSYTVSGNLSITENSTLKIVNTVVIFSFSSFRKSQLTDSGKLYLYNSEITMNGGPGGENSLNMTVNGTAGNMALLVMSNSTISLNGSLNVFNGNFEASNSTLGGMPHGSGFLGTDFFNSTVMVYNTTVSGERQQGNVSEYTAGMDYNSDPLYSNIGYVPLKGQVSRYSLTKVNSILVSLSYGGYTYGNASYVLFNVSGKTLLKYVLSSTGYPFNETTVNLSIPISGVLPSVCALAEKGEFTAFFNMVPYKTNTTLFNVSVSFNSNDTVSYYGKKFFGPVLYNSTFYSVRSKLQLGYASDYTSFGEYNPQKNAYFLYDGSEMYSVGSYAEYGAPVGDSSPFEIVNSSLYVYSFQRVWDMASEGRLNGFVNNITANNLNYSLNEFSNSQNTKMGKILEDYGIAYSSTSVNGAANLPLLRSFTNSTSSFYCGNYKDIVGGGEYYFSENYSNVYLNKSLPVTFNLTVPELNASLSHSQAIFGKPFYLNISVSSMYGPSNNLTVNALASNSSSHTVLRSTHASISTNRTLIINWSFAPLKSLNPGKYQLTVTFSGINYTYNDNNTLFYGSLNVFSSIDLGISYNYSWLSPGKGILLNATVSNVGDQYANNTALLIYFYAAGFFIGEYSSSANLGPESSVLFPVKFNSSAEPTNATIVVVPPQGLDPYNTSGQKLQVKFSQEPVPGTEYYYLNITRLGIPTGTLWGVVVNNTIIQSIAGSIMVKVAKGNCTFRAQNITGYHPANASFAVRISGNASVSVQYLQNNYSIEFLARGALPSYGWAITIGNSTFVPPGNTFVYAVHNGAYNYNVTEVPGYSISKGNGTVVVDNGNRTVVITFTAYHPKGNGGALLEKIMNFSPLIAASGALAGAYAYISLRRSAYICLKCGATLESWFAKCSCQAEGGRNNRK